MRKPPGFRGEEVCAEECNQPDKHENSQAHLPDLRGVVGFAHRSPSKLADGSKVYHILDCEFSNADCQLDAPKIGKCRGALLCEPPCLCGSIQKCERVSPVADTTPATFACRRLFASLAE